MKMRMPRLAITGLVLLHLAIVLAHGAAHQHLHVDLKKWQQAFVGGVIILGPLLALVILWTHREELGAVILAIAMAGSSAFGIFYHFLFSSADNIFFLQQSGWGSWFTITAALLAAIETTCFVWCVWILKRSEHGGIGKRSANRIQPE
jgi:hypothetical protein